MLLVQNSCLNPKKPNSGGPGGSPTQGQSPSQMTPPQNNCGDAIASLQSLPKSLREAKLRTACSAAKPSSFTVLQVAHSRSSNAWMNNLAPLQGCNSAKVLRNFEYWSGQA